MTEKRTRKQKRTRAAGAKKKRVRPPVSKATGGLLPGADGIRFSADQEMEDLEYMERMENRK